MTEKQHTRLWFSSHGTEWEAETYEEALEMERDALVEQLFEAQRQGRVWRAIANRDEPKVSADRTRLEEQLEARDRVVDAARVILTLADEERDEIAGEVSKYLGPWADLVEAVHAVSNPANVPEPDWGEVTEQYQRDTGAEPVPASSPETGNCADCGRPLTTEEAIRSDACPDCDPASEPDA